MSERYSLKWIEFQNNAARIFDSVRREKDFFDVTLVGGDLKQVSAHKLVLSACSPFFRNILSQNHHPNPLLFLDQVISTDLSLVLDYIYRGEVQIHQEQLDSFLLVARKLQLDGLSEEEHRQLKEQLNFKTEEQEQQRELGQDFRNKPPSGEILMKNIEEEDLQNIIISENLNRSIKFTEQDSKKKLKVNYSSVHEEFEVFDYFHPGLETFTEGRRCKICKTVFSGKNSTNLKSHLKTKHNDAFQRVQSRFL